MIVNGLCSTVGMVGAYIIILLLIIIALVIMTERSFISGVKKGSNKVYTQAKEGVTELKDNVVSRVNEKEYEKNKRIHKKVKGVSMQKISDGEESDEDIHEITGEFAGKLPENAHLYRGHVDVDKYAAPVNEEVEEEEIKEVRIETRHTVSMPERKVESSNLHNETKGDEPQLDEDGLFKPKERIVVSEEAKTVMNRKPFSGATVSNTQSAGAGLLSSSSTQNEKLENEVSRPKKKVKDFILPSTNLLNRGNGRSTGTNELELRDTAKKLENILANFGITAEVVDYSRGPSVTRYEIQPEIGTRLANITKLADDIKLHLAATDIRIEPIPGKSTIGIEVPNEGRDSVLIRELIESNELKNNPSKLAFAAGKDIAGQVIVGDIAKMPHLLVAGTTGSGKSVFTNSIIMSILFRAKPSEVRLIIVDPKVVEFGVYNGIPHLLQPVVTDPRLASNTLKWAVAEMSDRYKKFAEYNVRDLKGYNEKLEQIPVADGEEAPRKLPQIVIVIDELADLMMVAAKEVEESICRLAQLARAAGIHLIIATQRPSVNVVTGLIKANIPSRVALMVSSGVDSRTIIDQNGAEKLLGNGDMLFYPSGYVKPVRLQGAFVSDGEVSKVVEFWKDQAGDIGYDESIAKYVESQENQNAAQSAGVSNNEPSDGKDEYFFEAARFVIEKDKASTSMLQRMFKIGFNRAARIMDQMCEAGIVGEEEGTKPRKVLMTLDELESLK
ncbi:MAG: DNA translocase FtsK [Lachnospiraceae bacterium]|nr:DNA translocase FtsK [Lachnospiraceae bacterium]